MLYNNFRKNKTESKQPTSKPISSKYRDFAIDKIPKLETKSFLYTITSRNNIVYQQSRRPIFPQNHTIHSHTVITCSRHIEREKKKNTHRRSTRLPPPRSRNVACEHGTAQESPRNQPLIQLSPVGMERSLATETSRKGIFQVFSRARWLYAMVRSGHV